MKKDLRSGHELNVLVATKVMGLRLKRDDCNSYWIDADGNEPEYFTDFSRDIAAAWEIVEKLRLSGLTVEVDAYPESREWLEPPYVGAKAQEWRLTKGTTYYMCQTFRYEPDCACWVINTEAEGDSAAHAICLAALKTIKQ